MRMPLRRPTSESGPARPGLLGSPLRSQLRAGRRRAHREGSGGDRSVVSAGRALINRQRTDCGGECNVLPRRAPNCRRGHPARARPAPPNWTRRPADRPPTRPPAGWGRAGWRRPGRGRGTRDDSQGDHALQIVRPLPCPQVSQQVGPNYQIDLRSRPPRGGGLRPQGFGPSPPCSSAHRGRSPCGWPAPREAPPPEPSHGEPVPPRASRPGSTTSARGRWPRPAGGGRATGPPRPHTGRRRARRAGGRRAPEETDPLGWPGPPNCRQPGRTANTDASSPSPGANRARSPPAAGVQHRRPRVNPEVAMVGDPRALILWMASRRVPLRGARRRGGSTPRRSSPSGPTPSTQESRRRSCRPASARVRR